ncbi:ATP-binding protein [Streptomyces sp. DSM 40750]|uniref:ATP-binding protein n=1 Tax=Streptomyces sp. DSM 40750 TaxID=2801030 RepID=UPI0027D47900|nr:ATP-binding protein [Streptomyces sp. DSM 40750]
MRDQGDLVDTMSGNGATARSATSVAGARGSARHFLEGLVPATAVEAADTMGSWSFGARRQRPAPRWRRTSTLDLTAHLDSIEVAVHDCGPQAPHMRTPDLMT